MTPNPEQAAAIEGIVEHLRTTGDNPFLVLEGPAGTGKTFTVQHVRGEFKGKMLFTAPTNKATRVLREFLNKDGAREECRTTYSALGLQMQANGEVKELARNEDPVDLGQYRAIVVDEAGMVGSGTGERKGLMPYIEEASKQFPKLRWLFMGDPYQLPPVGESLSSVWAIEKKFRLDKVMRQDNQILTHVTHLRDRIDKPFAKINLASDNDGDEGIWLVSAAGLEQAILNHADTFLKGTESKAIAWRNVTVDRLNRLIRQELFEQAEAYPWQEGDRVTLLEPAKNFDDEIIGTTDEEGAVENVQYVNHPVHEDFLCWRVVMRSDLNTTATLWVLDTTDKSNVNKFEHRKARLAAEAKVNRGKWRDYWAFVESFHKVRHAYAITAHRAQGSTYQRAFVSYRDILINPNTVEGRRCLYVADSRPRKELYLG